MSTRAFIDQLYRQTLLTPSPSEDADWFDALERGDVDVISITQALVNSDLYQHSTGAISALYQSILGRQPDIDGLTFWVETLQTPGVTLDQIADAFLNSAEGQGIYGASHDNSAFLDDLYQQCFGREADAEGKAWWLAAMDNGVTQAEVIAGFTGSAEFESLHGSDQQTTALYLAVLNRIPTSDELDDAQGMTTGTLLGNLYSSEAYSGEALPGMIAGKVIDGYVRGATVFMDRDGDGQLDDDESSTTTDEDGDFTLFGSGTLVSIGGTDISTGEAIRGVMRAPDGSTVISPVTTVIQSLINQGQSTEQAQDLIAERMGLDNSLNLTNFDPLATATDSTASDASVAAALQLQSANLQLATTLAQASAVLEGAFGNGVTTDQAVNASVEALTQQLLALPGQTPLDLTNSSLITSTLQGAARQLDGAQSSDNSSAVNLVTQLAADAATIMTDANQRISTALSDGGSSPDAALEQAVRAQSVAQGEAADALLAGTQNGSLSDAVDDFSGDALDDQIDPPPAPPVTSTPTPTPTPTPTDSTAPVFQSASVDGDTLTLSYTDASNLDQTSAPAITDFTVTGSATGSISVQSALVSATAKTVTLVLSTSVAVQETVSISYTPGNNPIQDVHNNSAGALNSQSVTNDTTDTAAPVLQGVVLEGDSVTLSYTDASNLDHLSTPHSNDFVLTATDTGGNSISPLNVVGISVNGAAKMITLGLSDNLSPLDTMTLSYTPGNNPIQDAHGNTAAAITAQAVTNESPATALNIDTVIANLNAGDKVKLEDTTINLDGKLTTSWITTNASYISEIYVTNGPLKLTAAEFDAAITHSLPLPDGDVEIDLSIALPAELDTVLGNISKVFTDNITSLTLADDAALYSYRDAVSDDAIANGAITLTDGTITSATATVVSHSNIFAADTITSVTLTPTQLGAISNFDAFNTDAITLDANDNGAQTALQLGDTGDALNNITGLEASDTIDFSSPGIQFSNQNVTSSGVNVIGVFSAGDDALALDAAGEWQLDTANNTLTWWDAGQNSTESIVLTGVSDITTDGSNTITIA